MKKGILMIIFFILVVGLIETTISSCVSSSQKNGPDNNTTTTTTNSDDNNSNNVVTTNTEGDQVIGKEPDWSKAESKTIMGKIEYGAEDRITIAEKWESRSKVNYYVYGEYKSNIEVALKNAEKNKTDAFAKVKGLVPIESISPWTKSILIDEIIEISDAPIED